MVTNLSAWARDLDVLIAGRDAVALQIAWRLLAQVDDPERLIPSIDYGLLAEFRKADEAVKVKITERASAK